MCRRPVKASPRKRPVTFELRLEITPDDDGHVIVCTVFRARGLRSALPRALTLNVGGWQSLMSIRLPATADVREVDSMLVRIRARLSGDSRSEALLAA